VEGVRHHLNQAERGLGTCRLDATAFNAGPRVNNALVLTKGPVAPAMADPYAPDPTLNPRMAWMDRTGGGVWWLVAAAGIGLLLLAYVIAFFDRSNHPASAVFAMLGYVVLEAGLTLSALMGVRWPWGARVALMLGAALLALRGATGTVLF
ncbi:MAG: hypothetical protein QOI63_1622, partial [Thermoplasmata archaeon]|nr:hypothetical protein [Thermoplasmata archaeon]